MLNRSQLTNLALSNAPTEGHSEFDTQCIATCYIAGPMRGKQDWNFPAFDKATAALRDAGWFAYSPRENDAEAGLPTPEPGADTNITPHPLKWYMRKDLAQVASSDAVFFLQDWEYSQGAMLEHQVAQYLEIPCYRFEDGGLISIIGSDADGLILGIDHDQIEAQERVYGEHEAQLMAFGGRAFDFFEEPTAEQFLDAYPEARHPNSARFHELVKEMGELHDRKQRDYGAGDDPFANVRNSQGFGVDPWVGAMIRLNDKIKRLQSLQSNGRLENESAYDSFKDIAVYAVIALVLFEEQYGRESA